MIPILNLTRQYNRLKDRIDTALIEVAASGVYILGPQVQAFEKEMAEWMDTRHVVGCASGTDALFLALRALNIGPGDEVITTPFTYIATSESIVRTGAKPVFVDIDASTLNMDIDLLEAAITPRTKAIMPVHIFGQAVDMTRLMDIARKRGLFVIEDCAQAIGAEHAGVKVGNFGEMGCFSFFPSKNLGAFGDGGMITTRDEALADKLRMLRVHGSSKRYYHEEAGINSRLDEIQAAVLRVKLPYLNEWNQARREVAQRYNQLLEPLAEFVQTPVVAEEAFPVFHQYTLKLKNGTAQSRDELITRLQADGVQCMIYYPVPLYRQQTHAFLGIDAAGFPVCERVSDQVLSLPMFPEITMEEQETVVQALGKALRQSAVTA